MKDFSKFVKKQRKKTGLSLHAFSKLLNVSWITVWRWEKEKSKPPYNTTEFWKDKITRIAEEDLSK